MSQAGAEGGGYVPHNRRATVLGALAVSAPAICYFVVNALYLPAADPTIWFGMGAVLLLGLATAVSFVGLFDQSAASADGTPWFATGPSLGTRANRAVVGWAISFCYWVTPCIWVFLASYTISYVVGQLWGRIPMGSPWVVMSSATVLALGLSYAPLRGAKGIVTVLAWLGVVQVAVALVFLVILYRHFASAPTTPAATQHPHVIDKSSGMATDITLDSNGNPASDPAPDEAPISAHYFAGATDVAPPPVPPVPLEQRYMMVVAGAALFSLAVLQWVSSLGLSREKRPPVRRVVLILAVMSCGMLVLLGYLLQLAMERATAHFLALQNESSASATSAPIGDMMQMVGMYYFGSARAGWWFMMAMAALPLAFLIVSTWACAGSAARPAASLRGINGMLHFRILLRAGIAVGLCEVALQSLENHNQWFGAGLSRATAAIMPDVLSTVLLGVCWMVFILCLAVCAAGLLTALKRRRSRLYLITSAFGLLLGIACGIFYLAGLFILHGENFREFIWALSLCGLWGLGLGVRWLMAHWGHAKNALPAGR